MKNLLLLIALFWATFTIAQDENEDKRFDLNFGVGFPNTTHTAIDGASSLLSGISGLSTDGDSNGSSTPFYNVSGTYRVVENMGIGMYLGYFKSNSEILAASSLIPGLNTSDVGSTEYSVFSVGGKLELHENIFGDIKKLDTYASTFLGYNFVKDDVNLEVSGNEVLNGLANGLLNNTNFPAFTYEVNAGLKYDISDNVALFGEAGFGRFLLNTGITLRP